MVEVMALAAVGAFVLVRTMLFEQDPCSAESIVILAGAGSDLTARIPGFQVEGQRGCDSGDDPWLDWSHGNVRDSVLDARKAGCDVSGLDSPLREDQVVQCGVGDRRFDLYLDEPWDSGEVRGSLQPSP